MREEAELRKIIAEHVMNELGMFDPNDPNNQVKLVDDPKVLHGADWAKYGGNFPVERNGKTYYVSRSVSVSLCVYCRDRRGRWCVLANQRGPSTTGAGLWNVPSGFLDYGETSEDAAVRETWEETGVLIPDDAHIRLLGTNTGRFSGAQNVSMAFTCVLDGVTDDYPLSAENSEPGEVADIRWIPVMDAIGRQLMDYQKYRWDGNTHKVYDRAKTALLPYLKSNDTYDALVRKLKNEIRQNPTAMFLLNKILTMKQQ